MRALSACCALALALTACDGGESTKPKALDTATLVELDLTRELQERTAPLFSEGRPSHFEALLRVRKLARDPLARGIFARLGSFGGRHADVADWAEAFEAFRADKRPVHCHFDELDNAGYALAAHCDKLSMTPAGLLNLVGLAAQVVQGHALLERIGVQAQLVQVGKYKGAAEPFTRDSLSEEFRASLNALLADLDAAFRKHLAERAALPAGALDPLLNSGPYTADDALRAKLIDAISYDDEAREHARRAASARSIRRSLAGSESQAFSFGDLLSMLRGGEEHDYKGRPHLAVAFLTGEISEGEDSSLQGRGSASDPFVKTLRRWGDDTDVRAVLLRVESPGGSALASDRMWHAVRRVALRKPVVVSLGDMAASGGYYVASAGSIIIAAPSSVVGSIGVVGGKVVVSELAERLGISVTTLAQAQHATWLSPMQPFSDSERRALENMLERTYRLFLQRIAIGRDRAVSSLSPAAEGRVMGGERAQKLGLVDDVGGLVQALELALERGKLADTAPIETWPESGGALSAISSLVGAHASSPSLAVALEGALPPGLASASSLVQGLVRAPERPLTVLPFALQVR